MNAYTKVSIKLDNKNVKGALSNEDIRDIIKRSSDYFLKNEQGNFLNLLTLNRRLKQIGQAIQDNYNIYISSKGVLSSSKVSMRQGYTLNVKDAESSKLANYFESKTKKTGMDKSKLNKLVAEGYFLVMRFRKELLEENIDYMIYIGENNDPGNAIALRVQEENILKLLTVNSQALSIRQLTGNVLKEVKDSNKETGYEIDNNKTIFYQKFIPFILAKDFEVKIDNGTRYSVYWKLVRGQLKTYQNSLIKKETLGKSRRKQHRNRFTMGHISEAFDIGYDYMQAKNISYNYEFLREKFYENLNFDAIKATKGGDNAVDLKNQLSVKAFSATLYNIATVYGDMVQLTEMIDDILLGSHYVERAKMQLETMFFEQSKYNNAIENVGTKSMNEIIDESFKKVVDSVTMS